MKLKRFIIKVLEYFYNIVILLILGDGDQNIRMNILNQCQKPQRLSVKLFKMI